MTEESSSQPGGFGFTVLNTDYSSSTQSGSAQLPGVLAGVHADRMTDWTSTGLLLQQGFSADGKLVFASSVGSVTTPAGKKVPEVYGAAYPARTQWHVPLTGGPNWPAPPLTCQNDVIGSGSQDFRTDIAKAISCRLFTMGGHQEIDGVNTIKLVLKPQPGLGVRQTLWIDPTSYLPIRTVDSFVQPHARTVAATETYQWLRRTPANLAALRAAIRQSAIPSGFRSLPAADLPLPGLNDPSPG